MSDREPVDVAAVGRSRPLAHVGETVGAELRGLETRLEQATHHIVGEELHAAVGVVDHEPLGGAEELVRDHERTDGVVARPSSGVADHVGVALGQAGVLGRIEPGVHAGEDGETTGRRKGEGALGTEIGGIVGIGREHVRQNGHGPSFQEFTYFR